MKIWMWPNSYNSWSRYGTYFSSLIIQALCSLIMQALSACINYASVLVHGNHSRILVHEFRPLVFWAKMNLPSLWSWCINLFLFDSWHARVIENSGRSSCVSCFQMPQFDKWWKFWSEEFNELCLHASSFKSEKFNKSLDVETNKNNLFKI